MNVCPNCKAPTPLSERCEACWQERFEDAERLIDALEKDIKVAIALGAPQIPAYAMVADLRDKLKRNRKELAQTIKECAH